MFELFRKRLNQIANDIETIFVTLDKKAAAATDIYSKANKNLAAKVHELYVTLEICSNICSQYLLNEGIDLETLEEIPDKYRKFLAGKIEFDWKPFQHKVKQTLKKYAKYLDKLDQNNVDELKGIIEMTTIDILNIYDLKLKQDPEEDEDFEEDNYE